MRHIPLSDKNASCSSLCFLTLSICSVTLMKKVKTLKRKGNDYILKIRATKWRIKIANNFQKGSI